MRMLCLLPWTCGAYANWNHNQSNIKRQEANLSLELSVRAKVKSMCTCMPLHVLCLMLHIFFIFEDRASNWVFKLTRLLCRIHLWCQICSKRLQWKNNQVWMQYEYLLLKITSLVWCHKSIYLNMNNFAAFQDRRFIFFLIQLIFLCRIRSWCQHYCMDDQLCHKTLQWYKVATSCQCMSHVQCFISFLSFKIELQTESLNWRGFSVELTSGVRFALGVASIEIFKSEVNGAPV